MLRVKLVSPYASIPTRATRHSVGYDLYSAVRRKIKAGALIVIDTGLQMALPPGCYGRIAPKSGLTLEHHIDVKAGVIDPDYRGNIKVLLHNFGENPYEVEVKSPVAQLILERVQTPEVIEVVSLPETRRGNGGFGSTSPEASCERETRSKTGFASPKKLKKDEHYGGRF